MAADGEHSDALESKPNIDGLEWVWKAYVDLNSCRGVGMSVGPIPWTAFNDYSNHHKFDEYERQLLEHSLFVLDKINQDHSNG